MPFARILLLGAVFSVVVLCIPDGRADSIFLKDGFVLRGKVQEEGKMVIDRTEDGPILEFVRSGMLYMDDGCRRVIFNPQHVAHIEQKKIITDHDLKFDAGIFYVDPRPAPPIVEIEETSDWDANWNRTQRYRSFKNEGGEVKKIQFTLDQHLTRLTPEYAIADNNNKNKRYQLRSHYLTREFGPEQVRFLLASHKDLKDDSKLDDEKRIDRRFRIFHFFAQAEWLSEAGEELERIAADFPKAKERVDEARKNLAALKAIQLYDDIKRAHDAGQFSWVKRRFPRLPDSGLPEKMLTEMRELKAEYEAAEANLQLARRYLDELPPLLTADDLDVRPVLLDAARAIRDELHLEHFLKSKAELRGGDKEGVRVARLDTFLAQAQQLERDRKQNNGNSETRPVEVLALAVTGWLLGGRSAENKPEFARQLWLARKFALEYQKAVGVDARLRLFKKYQDEQSRRNPAISVEEFAQLLPFLPPPEPPAMSGTEAMEFTADSMRGGRQVHYWAKMPPDYHPGRPWPVLIVAHMSSETPKDALAHWAEQAERNGYILAAPEWETIPGAAYQYSTDEHNIILDLIRDLRRRFQVDSDRVFLTGAGSGGALAFDVGLSHPDQFAGVIPICGIHGGYGTAYSRNAQYLPYYVICGDHCNAIHKENRQLVKEWIGKVYPVLYVEYKGRGMEPYIAEAEHAFDWMNRKVRANPISENGAIGREFRMLRREDNHFYWLSTEKISPNCIMPVKWKPTVLPATMCAQVSDGNRISVSTYGLQQVSLWFGRGLKVDIEKPVVISVNLKVLWQQKVKPNLSLLLDDLYERGDRQRPYIARVDFKLE
jgi:acetyl esterase/lipase